MAVVTSIINPALKTPQIAIEFLILDCNILSDSSKKLNFLGGFSIYMFNRRVVFRKSADGI